MRWIFPGVFSCLFLQELLFLETQQVMMVVVLRRSLLYSISLGICSKDSVHRDSSRFCVSVPTYLINHCLCILDFITSFLFHICFNQMWQLFAVLRRPFPQPPSLSAAAHRHRVPLLPDFQCLFYPQFDLTHPTLILTTVSQLSLHITVILSSWKYQSKACNINFKKIIKE